MEKLLWPAINLVGLLGFIAYKTKAPFFSFVRGRRNEIFEGLNKSKIQVEEAQKRRAEIDSRLSGLELEKSKIASEWKEKSLAQTQAIRDGSVKIIEQMKLEAQQNQKALIQQTQKTIQMGFRKSVLTQAEQKISQALNSGVHAKINERLVNEVSRGGGA